MFKINNLSLLVIRTQATIPIETNSKNMHTRFHPKPPQTIPQMNDYINMDITKCL